MADPRRGSFATETVICSADSQIRTDELHSNSDCSKPMHRSGSFLSHNRKVSRCRRSRHPKRKVVTRGVVNDRASSNAAVRPHFSNSLQKGRSFAMTTDNSWRRVWRKWTVRMKPPRKKLGTLANYRRDINNKERASSLRLARLLGSHLGVSPEMATTVLARIEAETKAEPSSGPTLPKVNSRPTAAQRRKTPAQQSQPSTRTRRGR